MDNIQFTDDFSLFELTKTNNIALQAQNRILTLDQIAKLKQVAMLLQVLSGILNVPLTVNSGYRCPQLNKATNGSSLTSQHLKCEAADVFPEGMPIADAFVCLRAAAKLNKFSFGQLILEEAHRDYGTVQWIHISLGSPYRDFARCGEILLMKNGHYNLIETVPLGLCQSQ